MPKRRSSLPSIVGPIVATILIYVTLGGLVTVRGIVIYDSFPREDFVIDDNTQFYFDARNNAPFTFPFVNFPFAASLEISNTTGKVGCEIATAKGYVSWNATILDLGQIPVGQTGRVTFRLRPNRNGFTVKCTIHANVFGALVPSASKSYRVTFYRSIGFQDKYNARLI
mgnify:CR=1 FL=1